jgi:endonuclease/exonuclease/phosphatase family metal-dependent hydrolase
MMDLIRKESPDIICLQEYYNGKKSQSNYADTILRSGKCKYHYDAYIHNGKKELPFGLITFSKYPILAARKVQYSNTYQSYCIVVDIALPNDTVRVINTHLESIRFGKEDYLFVNDLSANTGKADDPRQGSRVILSKIKHAFQKRGSQADELSEMIKNSPYKVILCADLNDTPSSYAYRKINSSLNDAFKEAGSGIGQTYTGFLPILRIDYIFADRSFRIAEYRTINNKLSDHYPIVSRIALQ